VTVIIRVEHRDKYVMVRNRTVRDSRLSFKARGILVYLLSLPDDATVDRAKLAAAARDGEDSVRTGLQELAAAGYLVHRRVQNERGRWLTEAVIYESPRRARTDGGKTSTGTGETGGGKSTSRSSTFKDQRGAADRTPAGSSSPPKYQCAACGAAGVVMRPDETWLCEGHRTLKVVG
jgi:hypothetical protein